MSTPLSDTLPKFYSRLLFGLKLIVKKLPVSFTKNQEYDRQTRKIIQKICKKDSNCIDIGTHKGEILDFILKVSPQGMHFGFEPLPFLFHFLQKKYSLSDNVHLFPYALSNHKGTSSFNHVITNPAYSGLKKRKYDRNSEKDEIIHVQTEMLDDIIPRNVRITLIKIDVEGGELDVLQGGINLIRRHRPLVIFEFGIGGSDIYGATPEDLFEFFSGLHYSIYLMKDYLQNKPALGLEALKDQFHNKRNYYFMATPGSAIVNRAASAGALA